MLFQNPLLDYQGRPEELRALDYFRSRTASRLAGWFDAAFWNEQLPQVGHGEPTIRHAMIAVASAHEQLEILNGAIPAGSKLDTHALEVRGRLATNHYIKAISTLRMYLAQSPESTKLTLLCCILFVTLEILRGNSDSAVVHLHSGLQILTNWREDQVARATNIEEDSIEDNLIQILDRLSFQSCLCENPLSYLHPKIPLIGKPVYNDDSATFPNLVAARNSLNWLSKEALRLIRDAQEPVTSHEGETLIAEFAAHRVRFSTWSTKFTLLLSAQENTLTTAEKQGACELQIISIIGFIWLEAAPIQTECAFDAHTEKFELIIDLAQTLFSENDSADHTRENFSLEMGILPPIFFVAIKCRHRVVRRRAVALLDRASVTREGMWDGGLLARFAERTVEIEEEGLGPLEEWDGNEYPTEAERARDSFGMVNRDPEMRPIDDMMGFIRTKKTGDARVGGQIEIRPRSQTISFFFQPDGKDGPWLVRRETLNW